MAKRTADGPIKPQVSHGYSKILGATLLAMLAGCGLIALEMSEYDWQSEAKASPAPKVTPIPAWEPAKAPAPMGGN